MELLTLLLLAQIMKHQNQETLGIWIFESTNGDAGEKLDTTKVPAQTCPDLS